MIIWSFNGDFKKWEYVEPTSVTDGCVIRTYACGTMGLLRGSIAISEEWKLYDNYLLGTIPPSLRPAQDAYGLSINGSRLSVVIIYSTGEVKLRPFIMTIPFRVGESTGINVTYAIG